MKWARGIVVLVGVFAFFAAGSVAPARAQELISFFTPPAGIYLPVLHGT